MSLADLSALADLPVNACLAEAAAVLAQGANLLLVAPPGAGKTTLVPLALLNAPWRGDGVVLVLEPRRLAARAAATRMAALLNEPPGGQVGYRTRLEQAVSARTRIEVVTTGLLLRRLLSDPGLTGVAAVILDEVHERALEADLALALLLDLQAQLRPELRLIAMSATAEMGRLSALMRAELVRSEGRAHPVELVQARADLAHPRDLPEAMARAIRAALAEHAGDLLCFLPGMAEIRRTQAALAGAPALILPLHGDLPVADQQRALTPAGQRRVVLSTSIAETSLTVPGVRVVIDGGWRRAPRLDAATGLTRLATLRISRAAAAQRAGRAGREAPGVAIRLWSAATQRAMAEFDRPEILEAELSGLVLDCAAWGAAPATLGFIDPPPAGPLAAGAALLESLGALHAGRLTELGARMAALGAHPRLAAMMLAAQTDGARALACDLAAALEERDFLTRPQAREWPLADMALRAAVVQGGPEQMERGDIDRGALARVRQAAGQYRRRLGLRADAPARGETAPLLAHAFPDRVAQSRGEPGRFRLSSGGSASLPVTDPLARARLLVVASLDLAKSARIALAATLDGAELPPVLAAQVQTSVETALDPVTGAVLARRRRRLGALVLDDRTEPADPALRAELLARRAGEDLATLPWTEPARQFQARVSWMRGIEPDRWPDLSDAALAAEVQHWLAPALEQTARLDGLDMLALLRARLDWAQLTRLDQSVPATLELPRGAARVDYTQPVPEAAARAQAFYGLSATPRLANGRVPLRLALLSPAGRPIAITADLHAFWQGVWAEVRKEMRGRYPRHEWPEKP
jgi:ATP-dependent helicase HrpB